MFYVGTENVQLTNTEEDRSLLFLKRLDLFKFDVKIPIQIALGRIAQAQNNSIKYAEKLKKIAPINVKTLYFNTRPPRPNISCYLISRSHCTWVRAIKTKVAATIDIDKNDFDQRICQKYLTIAMEIRIVYTSTKMFYNCFCKLFISRKCFRESPTLVTRFRVFVIHCLCTPQRSDYIVRQHHYRNVQVF